MSAISRTQAWCKLAVLIADGLPAPRDICFSTEVGLLHIYADCRDDFYRLVAHFKAEPEPPYVGDSSRAFIQAPFEWEGWAASVRCHYDIAAAEPVTEDMTSVREIAEAEVPRDGHVYACCGKVGRISRHEPWCEPHGSARAVSE